MSELKFCILVLLSLTGIITGCAWLACKYVNIDWLGYVCLGSFIILFIFLLVGLMKSGKYGEDNSSEV